MLIREKSPKYFVNQRKITPRDGYSGAEGFKYQNIGASRLKVVLWQDYFKTRVEEKFFEKLNMLGNENSIINEG